MKFTDIKKQHASFEAFVAWANQQEFTDLKKGNSAMDYCDLQLGERKIQHRIYGLRHGLGNFLAPMMRDESFHTWESIFGKDKAEAMAKKYDAEIMEAPYCETEGQGIEFVLNFNTFEGCLRYLWETAEQHDKLNDLFKEYAGTKTLQELYKMSCDF